jgi:hypothetical protein
MQARKKPGGTIEVEQYHAGQPLPAALEGIVQFSGASGAPMLATVYNKPQHTQITVNDGDYVRIDMPDDIYPIAAAYFAQNYDLVG